MTSTRRSIVLATFSHYAAQAIGITSMLLLSRLLLPTEIGVYSIGAAVLAIIHVFRDFGVSSYLTREPTLDKHKVGTCFAVSLAIAWLSALVLLLLTPMVVNLYALPGLRSVLYVLIANLLLVPFSSIRIALLRRDMRFDALLWVEIVSALANAGVAVGMALAGYSYISLAYGNLAAMVASTAVARLYAVSIPLGRPSLASWRSVCSFGGMSLTLNLVIRLSTQAPMLIVGKLVDMQATGLLSRAMGLSELLLTVGRQTVATATFSAVSAKLRDGQEIGTDYRQAVAYLAVVAMPISAFMIVMARPLLHAMFGPHWEAADNLVQIFCFANLFLPFTIFNGSFLVAAGRIDSHLRIESLFSPLKAAVWLLAAPFDLLVAARGYVLLHLLSLAVSCVMLDRVISFDWRQVMRSLVPCIPISLAAVLPATLLLATDDVTRFGSLATLSLGAAAGAAAWLATLFLFRHPFAGEVRLLATGARQTLHGLTRR